MFPSQLPPTFSRSFARLPVVFATFPLCQLAERAALKCFAPLLSPSRTNHFLFDFSGSCVAPTIGLSIVLQMRRGLVHDFFFLPSPSPPRSWFHFGSPYGTWARQRTFLCSSIRHRLYVASCGPMVGVRPPFFCFSFFAPDFKVSFSFCLA